MNLPEKQTGEGPVLRIQAAVNLAREGRVAEAEAELRVILRTNPDSALAHNNLAVALADQGRSSEAIDSFRKAIRLAPGYVEAHLNFAKTLADVHAREQAVGEYRQVLALRPDCADALNGLGLTLTELRRPAEAAVYLRQALRLREDFAEAYNNLGLAFADQGKFLEAEAAYDKALHFKQPYIEAQNNLGSCYAHQNRIPEALAQYDLALWLQPDHVSSRWNRSITLLQSGDYVQGWREYEWRHRRKKNPARTFSQPMWDGSDLAGKTLLLWCEQGLGDTLQFCRYMPLVKGKKPLQLAFECPSPLLKLLRRFRGVDQLVPEGHELPSFDVHAPLMSLPFLLGTKLSTVPADVPYIVANSQRIEYWQQRLKVQHGLKVGIAWQGNPHHQWDRYRSIPLDCFAPLAKVPGIQMYSLQRGPGSEQARTLGQKFPLTQVLDAELSDAESWVEIAAIMKNLDVVVTVDTATAHLAGALGVRTCVALARLCDWRWLLDRTDSPWYPTLRLFRQTQLGAWETVFQEIAAWLAQSNENLRRLPLNPTKATGNCD